MKSLDDGETAVRGVRVPDQLWDRVERWAATRGQETSDALRTVLEDASSGVPEHGLVIRSPRRAMLRTLWHDCFRKHPRFPGTCDQQWAHRPQEWVLVSVDGLLFDDLFNAALDGRIKASGLAGWSRVPARALHDVAVAFRGNEHRLKIHHLTEGEGPRLFLPAGEK